MGDVPTPGPVPPQGLHRNTLAREHVGVGLWCRHSSEGLQCLLGRHGVGAHRGLAVFGQGWDGAGAMARQWVLHLGSCWGEVSASTARGTVT